MRVKRATDSYVFLICFTFKYKLILCLKSIERSPLRTVQNSLRPVKTSLRVALKNFFCLVVGCSSTVLNLSLLPFQCIFDILSQSFIVRLINSENVIIRKEATVEETDILYI